MVWWWPYLLVVALLVGFDGRAISNDVLLSLLAGLGAAFCYGLASVYAGNVKDTLGKDVSPTSNALGSLIVSSAIMAPLMPFAPIQATPDWIVVCCVLVLGLICSGLAYLLYFNLIKEIGAQKAVSVAYLIPAFGILWGYLFLNEPVGWNTLGGAMLVFIAVSLITGFDPRQMFKAKPT